MAKRKTLDDARIWGSVRLNQDNGNEFHILEEPELQAMYYQMLLSREVSDRVWALNRQGKVAIVGSSHGNEAAEIGAAWAMDRSRDLFYTYYRNIALVLALGVTAREVLFSYMAKEGEPFSGARQFPLHGVYPKLRIVYTSNVVTANVPHAVGAALAAKIRQDSTVILSTFGEGGTSLGEWHDSLNFAGIHRLPVVFLCENNGYAISVPQLKQMSVDSGADRASSYGFPGISIDGTNVLAVYEAVSQACTRARLGAGPTLIEAKVERLMPHTTDDDDRRYRSSEELDNAKLRDPLPLFKDYILTQGILTEEQALSYHSNAREEVNRATEEADAAPFPSPDTLLDHVYGTD